MKKLLLRVSLFICGICVGQPSPPPYAYNDNKFNIHYHYKEEIKYSTFNVGINMGTLKSLGGEVDLQHKRHIVGFGYAGNINSYKGNEFKNETLYLTYAYDFQPLVVGVRLGKQNNADWVPTSYNPNTKEKQVTPYSVMAGVYVGYKLNERVRVNVGCDSFNQFFCGLTFGV